MSCMYVFGRFFVCVYISQTRLEASILGSGQSLQADCPHPFFFSPLVTTVMTLSDVCCIQVKINCCVF